MSTRRKIIWVMGAGFALHTLIVLAAYTFGDNEGLPWFLLGFDFPSSRLWESASTVGEMIPGSIFFGGIQYALLLLALWMFFRAWRIAFRVMLRGLVALFGGAESTGPSGRA